MNAAKWIVTLTMAIAVFYAAYVWSWSSPRDEMNQASQILGGCETTESVSLSEWSVANRLVPPFVRCILRELRKDQILAANFRQGWHTDISTLQHYVRMGDIEMIPKEVLSEYRLANRGIVLRSLDWLIENGVDPNQCAPNGLTALHLAIYFERLDLYHKWVASGANPDNTCEDQDYIAPSGRIIERIKGSAREWLVSSEDAA